MKSIHLAPLALSLGLASAATLAFGQSAQDTPADFGPPPAPDAVQPPLEPGMMLRAPADFALQPAPQEAAPLAAPEISPRAPADQSPLVGETRRAAPEVAPRATRGPSAQTGPYLGGGLFNNSGPDDFGA